MTVYIGLGANLGHRVGALQDAVATFEAHPKIAAVQASPVYETAPHTLIPGEQQPSYLNAVVRFDTLLPLPELLELCLEIERRAGRMRHRGSRWAPRTLDLDVLVYGAVSIDTERLAVPHPRMGRRRFVLQPLFDLAPNLYVPEPLDTTVDQLLAACPDTDVPQRTHYTLQD